MKIVRLLCLLLAAGWLATATGQAQPAVVKNEAIVDFPETVTFRLELPPGSALSDARLTYSVGRNSCLAAGTQVPVEVTGSTLEWTWVLSRSGNPPPGATMWWEWTVTDAAGATITTPRQELAFADERFNWRTVTAEGLRLHWYEGDEVGPALLEAAVAGLQRLEQDMGIELQNEAQLFIYGSAADMRQAVLYTQEWAGGLAFSEYNIILIGVPPSIAESWGVKTVRHELAHLVAGQFGQSCVGGSRPTWLEEGLAMYAEGEPGQEILDDIAQGIEENTLAPVRSLNGAFPAHGGEATLAYSQSYSLVAFLLETYGREKMQELLLTLAAGEGYDTALEQVYGFNADGLEVAWRQAIGAPPRQIPPTPTPILAASVPTVAPLNPAQSVPTPLSAAGVPAPTTTGRPAVTDVPAATTVPAATAAPATTEEAPGRSPGVCGLGLVPLLLVSLAVWPFRRQAAPPKANPSSRR
ncbi:MAG: hypothetical protein L0332_33390 [Chloroflexi bacterium]|nr:hypothetical protein [Chloroflexota bacterium]MCI0577289.1 hypothetical protein [Chloroflexota bacterium]MCI0647733.1 hypothetical protein [Chloroflexota bacterium]MCI0731597.1 hypothetical protein [Chloroflexota bacterium]